MELEQITNETGADSQDREQARRQKQRFFTIPNVIGLILCVLFLPGFLISTTLLVSSLIHPDIPPSCFGYTPLMVETSSMIPLFDEEDLILVKNTASDASYRVDDVVCYHVGDVYVTHRVNEITADENGNTVYITKGDANNTPDRDPVLPEQILGVYVTHFEGWGKALLFIQTPVGMIVCVMLPIFVVILLFTVPPRIAAFVKRRKQRATRRAAEDLTEHDAPDGQ